MKEIVTAFGYPFFVRAALPGIVLLTVLWPILGPVLFPILAGQGTTPIEFGAAFLLVSIFFGWLMSLLDYPIYMVFEGRLLWPRWLSRRLESRFQPRIDALLGEAEKSRKTNSRITGENYWRLRGFPLVERGRFEARAPTRLGNLLQSFELYPLSRYGMDSVFYWPRLKSVLKPEVREDLNTSAAEASALVYLAFSLVISAAIYDSVALLQLVASLLALPAVLPGIEINPGKWALAGILLLFASYGSYLASLHLHRTYGELFKSAFDVSRSELKEKIGLDSTSGLEPEIWKQAFYRLQYLQKYAPKPPPPTRP